MTGLDYTIVAYVIGTLLLGGYAARVWWGYKIVARKRQDGAA